MAAASARIPSPEAFSERKSSSMMTTGKRNFMKQGSSKGHARGARRAYRRAGRSTAGRARRELSGESPVMATSGVERGLRDRYRRCSGATRGAGHAQRVANEGRAVPNPIGEEHRERHVGSDAEGGGPFRSEGARSCNAQRRIASERKQDQEQHGAESHFDGGPGVNRPIAGDQHEQDHVSVPLA